MVQYLAACGPEMPLNYNEAIQGPYAEQWQRAMEEEFNLLTERGTWKLEYLPNDRSEVSCTWTFVIKLGPDGSIV